MLPVKLDARLAELASLDVLDVRPDGSFRLNATFVAECLAAHAGAPAPEAGALLREQILARAAARGRVPRGSAVRLAHAVLQVEPRQRAA